MWYISDGTMAAFIERYIPGRVQVITADVSLISETVGCAGVFGGSTPGVLPL